MVIKEKNLLGHVQRNVWYSSLSMDLKHEQCHGIQQQPRWVCHYRHHKTKHNCTGKSLSEALTFTSIIPQNDTRLFMDLPVQYMKTTCAEHVLAMFCPCSVLVVFICWTGNSMNNLLSILWVGWCKNKCFWKRFTC